MHPPIPDPTAAGDPSHGRLTYVVGHARGGTSWLGALVACHPGVRYLFEPFASQAHACTGIDMQTVFNGGRFIHRDKVGRPVADIPIPRFFRTAAGDRASRRLAALAATHLAEVARQAFPKEHGYHLVVKQPRIENVVWAAAAIGADHVVALDRHPFGVVNSVRRWRMLNWTRIDWAVLGSDDSLSAADRDLMRDARSPEERLLVTTWLRSRFVREFAAARPDVTVVEYEALCADPSGEMGRLWRTIGLDEGPAGRAALAALLARRGEGEDERGRFHNVCKDPAARLHAWRRELPESIRRRLETFVRRHALPIPLPGAGLPDLSAAERWHARRADLLALGEHCRRAAKAAADGAFRRVA